MIKYIYFFIIKRIGFLVTLLALLLVSCSQESNPVTEQESSPKERVLQKTSFPAQGTSSTLDFGTWNLEWFGDPDNGPSNEQLQLENVQFIISGLDMDVWSVQEVTGLSHFEDLVSQLSGYDGFLANDPFVTDGPEYYSDFEDNEMKVGLIYKTDMISVSSAKVILKDYDFEFAGRPPVEVQLSATVDGTTQDLVIILLHAKAGSRGDAWERRFAGSEALKSHLDNNWPDAHVMIIGDFNDDVDESIQKPKDSPYQNFVDDASNFVFPTKELSDAGIASMVYYDDVVDHHLSTDELIAKYENGTVQVFPADEYLEDYPQTTSDHYPVLSSYTLSGDGGGDTNTPPTSSFTFDCSELSCDFDGSGSSDSDGSITDYSWDFGDGNAGSGVSISHAYSSGDTYNVTLTVTDNEGANSSDSQDLTVTESSTEGITLSVNGYKQQGNQKADLTWSNATSTDVDVYRDNALIVTTENDGSYTDNINNKGGGSYTYQICEAGSTTCSNEATVSF